MKTPIETGILSGNLLAVDECLRGGADPNGRDEFGDPLLLLATRRLECSTKPYETTKLLLRAGADPNIAGDHCNIVLKAIFERCYEVVELLLESGANPNAIVDGETLYDAAEFDYRFEEYDLNLPEQTSSADRSSEDAWLVMLDRLAKEHGKRAPNELHMLRRYGARSSRELP